MKTVVLFAILPFAAIAQPGNDPFPWPEPCGLGYYDVPLQNIARNDVRVMTTSQGTDDVPSSSGHCIRQLMLAEHADFLLEMNHQGDFLIAEPKAGDVLHPDSLAAGIAAGRLRWGKVHMPICYRGYGSQSDKGWQLIEPRTWERSIVRVVAPEGTYLVAMTVAFRETDDRIEVYGRRVVEEGSPLPMQ